MIESIRKEFEKWYSNDGAYPKAVERSGDGEYILMGAESAWNAWNAALKAPAPPTVEEIAKQFMALSRDDMEQFTTFVTAEAMKQLSQAVIKAAAIGEAK